MVYLFLYLHLIVLEAQRKFHVVSSTYLIHIYYNLLISYELSYYQGNTKEEEINKDGNDIIALSKLFNDKADARYDLQVATKGWLTVSIHSLFIGLGLATSLVDTNVASRFSVSTSLTAIND